MSYYEVSLGGSNVNLDYFRDY